MANEENLRPFTKENPPSREQAKKNGSKGGKARAAKAKERKQFAEHLQDLLNLPMDSHQKPRDFDKSKSAGDVKNHGITVMQASVQALVNKMLKGDPRAIELGLELLNQKPAAKAEIEVTKVRSPDEITYDEAMKLLEELKHE